MHSIKAHAHKVHKSRHAHLGLTSTSNHPGHAKGGATHPHKGHSAADERADKALIHSIVKPDALKRAHGGRTHKDGKSGTHVNILVGHPGGDSGAQPIPVPMGGPGPQPAPPMAGRPPMPPMGAGAGGPPPGGIGGAPVIPPRKHGGNVRHK